ncbi:hypothetical protein C9426_09990 [Serratia sp. S1B]|nr:hypothetical protein C9426_09990 [Serratia sp. S1B]
MDGDRFGARIQSSIENISVKNVMNPLLWLCGLVTIPCLVIIANSDSPHWIVQLLAAAPVMVVLFMYCYFAIHSPDRLQSENYQLRKQALDLIEEKGSLAIVDSSSIEVISNPDLPPLLTKEKKSNAKISSEEESSI